MFGSYVWGDPESRWGNAAVGAAIGMAAGTNTAAAVRIPFVRLRF